MNVLVLCTGNSCRSQMAEAFFRFHGFSVKSAGIEKHGMNQHAVKVMKEIGIDISMQYSKTIDQINLKEIDLLVTVCDHAKQSCPTIPGIKNVFHKSFEDPASYPVNDPADLLIYRTIRDKIKQYVSKIVKQINNYNG